VKLANDVNIAVATKLMGYYIRHTNESKALADSERSGLPPTPWEFRGNGDTFAIVDKNDRLVFELPYIEETDKEPLDTASGRLVVMIVDAVNAKGRNDQT
jgi:hypothetical protein